MQTDKNTAYGGMEELFNVEFSMPGYNGFIVNLIHRHLADCRRVVDFGAGIGTLSTLYAQKTGALPLCVEIDAAGQSTLKSRGFPVYRSLPEISGDIDGIYSSNVLEHIEDDRAVMRQMYDKLRPGGRLVLYLPAFQMLFSGLDASVGHYRRYGRADLCSKLKSAGFEIASVRYADAAGFFAALAVKLLGYDAEKGLGSQASLRLYDRFVFPVSRELDALGLRFLFGKNIAVMAVKPDV